MGTTTTAIPILFSLHRQIPALKLFASVAIIQFFLNIFFGNNHKVSTTITSATNDLLSDSDDIENIKEKEITTTRPIIKKLSSFIYKPIQKLFYSKNKKQKQKEDNNYKEEYKKKEEIYQTKINQLQIQNQSYQNQISSLTT